MCATSHIRKILEHFPIKEAYTIEALEAKNEHNKVWKIGNDYYLKKQDRSKIIREIQLTKQLNALGLHSITPIKTKTNEDFLQYSDSTFLLTKNMQASPLKSEDWFGSNQLHYVDQCGMSIAKLHHVLLQVELDTHDNINMFSDIYKNIILRGKEHGLTLSDQFIDEYKQFVTISKQLPRQPIHRDINQGNLLFNNGELVGFIDFELYEKNIRIFDPCYLSTGILSETKNSTPHFKQWINTLKHILLGYDSVSPLTGEEKDSIYYVLCSIQLVFIEFFATMPDYQFLVEKNREILLMIMQHKDDINGIFTCV